MASKVGNGTWWNIDNNVDPWSYEQLLIVKERIGAKTESAALRYILRRAVRTLPRKLRAGLKPVG